MITAAAEHARTDQYAGVIHWMPLLANAGGAPPRARIPANTPTMTASQIPITVPITWTSVLEIAASPRLIGNTI